MSGFTVKKVRFEMHRILREEMDVDYPHKESPSDETIRRVLRAAEDLGTIDHYSNSTRYEFPEQVRL